MKKVILIFGVTRPLSLKNGQMRPITAFCSFLRKYQGNSTETVAFQVYEILKINLEFLQFF